MTCREQNNRAGRKTRPQLTRKEYAMNCMEATHAAMRHTPGPWNYDMDYIVAPDLDGRHPDIYIAEIAHTDDEGRIASPQQQDANRCLIAAAPELLRALRNAHRLILDMGRIIRGLDDNHEWLEFWTQDGSYLCCDSRFDAIQSAIAKATAEDFDWR
jgi:hypothetical protein